MARQRPSTVATLISIPSPLYLHLLLPLLPLLLSSVCRAVFMEED